MAARVNHFVGSFADDATANSYISGKGWTAEIGWEYLNTTSTEIRWWNGTAWQTGGTDSAAIHDNVPAEINAITPKATPVGADELLIEDSEAGTPYTKKKLLISNLPGGAPLASTPPVNVTKSAAVTGTGTSAARDDHKHDVTTAAAGAATPGDSAAEGTATSLARSDHQHSLPAFGSASATFCEGDDARLSDARAPTAHNTTHQSGGADAIKLDDLATPDDNTDLNSSLTEHGLLPKLGGGTTNFLRADGSWAAPGGSSGDVRTAAIVVGNSVAGDTSDNCDYLDVGDGVQLVAALAAASGKDVYIRPGTYDLGSGVAAAPFTVLAGVRVRGAGRGLTTIKTKASGDQGAWLLNAGSVIEDMDVDVTLPTGVCSGQTSVVLLNAANAEAHRIQVNFLGTYTATESGYSVLKGVFGAVTNSVEDAKLVDCTAGTKAAPVPSFIALGEALADALRTIYIPSTTSALNVVDIRGLISHGADIGIDLESKARVSDYTIYDAYRYGAWAHDCDSVALTQGEINMVADQGNEVGILLDTLTDADVDGSRIIASTGSAGTKAVEFVNGDRNGVRGVRVSSGWQYGVDLDASSSDNIVTLNQLGNATTPTRDLGSLNEVVHNRV